MLDYFINVGLSFMPYLETALSIFLGVYVIPSILMKIVGMKVDEKLNSMVKKGAAAAVTVILIVGLIISFTSSANTFKLEQHDKVQLNRQIESRNMNRAELEIVDRNRKPEMTSDERADRFNEIIDYRK